MKTLLLILALTNFSFAGTVVNTVGVPPGTIIEFAGPACPSGYVAADGTSDLKTTNPNLYAAIGVNWGSVDGSHYNRPDLRGIFLKGSGTQTISGVVQAGTFATKENDQFQDWQVGFAGGYYGYAANVGYAISGSPNGSYILPQFYTGGQTNGGNKMTAMSDGGNGTPRKGTVTKPANVAITFCIKI